MEASESAAVLDSEKGHIDPESLKRWEDKEMLDSTRHLFITGEDRDRPISEGQEGEQDTIDEDTVSDADSSILSDHKPHPTPPPLLLPPSWPKKKKLSNADSTPNTTTPNPLDFYSK